MGDDRVGEEIMGVRQIVTAQAGTIVDLETKLKSTQDQLESEKGRNEIMRDSIAGVSYRVPLRPC